MIIFDDSFDMDNEITKVILTEKDKIRGMEAYGDDGQILFNMKWTDSRKIKLSLEEVEDE